MPTDLSDLRGYQPVAEMVGRELDLIGVQGRLQDPSVRLATLTGAGGVGKSRLATAAARSLADDFPGGVATVDLPACGSADAALKSTEAALRELRAEARCLLVLDGVEHLTDALAPFVAEQLDASGHLTVLATGQEALGIYGERIVPVAPLPVPGPLLEPDVTDVQDNPAVQLFTRRAHETNPDFTLTAENVEAVVDICNLLEGVPLVLELAARRLRLYPLQELVAWLRRGGDSHLSGPVDVPPRQRSTLAIADWSCRGLTGGQRALLARLALSRHGTTLAGAEKVSPLTATETADALEALLDRSLLTIDERPLGEARLMMSRTIRVYGLALLDEAGEAEAAAARADHARHYHKLMRSLEGRFQGSEQQRWLRVAAAEHDNVLVALRHLKDTASPLDQAALVAACLRPWLIRGALREGLAWFDSAAAALQAEDRDENEETLRARARLSSGAGALTAALGDHDGACHHYRRAVSLGKRLKDSRNGALASARMGLALFHCGDRAVGRSLLTAALTTLDAQGDTGGSAEAGTALAEVLLESGEPGEAAALLDRSERIQRQHGEIRSLACTLHTRARLALRGDDEAAAQAALRESIGLYDSIDERTELPAVLDDFALLIQSRAGQPQRATRLFAAAEALRRRTGVKVAGERWERLQAAVSELRRQLGWTVFATAWVEGLRLAPEAMAKEALAAVEPGRAEERTEAATLTPRQLQVALLVAEGMTNRQIANHLKIAEWTVVNHVRNVMRKLDCNSRVQVAWAVGRRQ
ncbi:ATP-binding protein [Streptomyces beihaiensis]|uniref:LuxR C-terminal-related transcriptional regulator n=1 Tax=Streptomyces beihaiensis TaxID=2984495 RepID=A0ABT3TV07_9ACTN|nr:LuxR C-terminal-related transcriptional regulator [Streptomyces beihaiensis]MCX3060866.1 LuxR C-terminal-related transcriptional regulator [Streptomyces beihaiensis]